MNANYNSEIMQNFLIQHNIKNVQQMIERKQEVFDYVYNTAKENGLFTQRMVDKCNVKVMVDGRLKRQLGYYQCTISKTGIIKPTIIKINREYSERAPLEQVLSTFMHEMCHYILSCQYLDFRDGDETFEHLLKLVGSHSTRTQGYEATYHFYMTVENRFVCRNTRRRKQYEQNGATINGKTIYYVGRMTYEDFESNRESILNELRENPKHKK